jgi:hypothetical protein
MADDTIQPTAAIADPAPLGLGAFALTTCGAPAVPATSTARSLGRAGGRHALPPTVGRPPGLTQDVLQSAGAIGAWELRRDVAGKDPHP